MKYRSVQFTANGYAWIFDHEANTVQEVWDRVNDQGSKWIFYPIPFVVVNKWGQNFKYSKIVDAPFGFEFLKGKTVNTAREYLMNSKSK